MPKNFVILAPIENFVSEENFIDFGLAATIVKFSPKQVAALREEAKIFDPFYTVNEYGYSINVSFDDSNFRAVDEKFQYSLNNIGKLISFLRLFKKGNVGIKLAIMFEVENDNYSSKTGTYSPTLHYFSESEYVLLKSEVSKFKSFTDIFLNTKISDSCFWSLGLSRLESSYGQRKPEDKLIDFTIGLEALFAEGPGDLRFKLASRIARLLGKTKDERIRISIAIKKIYDFRSTIVHGEIQKDPDFSANVDRAEDFLRKSLRKMLEMISIHGENKDELLRIVDFEM